MSRTWVKIYRKIIKSVCYPGHGLGYGESFETNIDTCFHVWLSCGHEKDIYKNNLPKMTICTKCSYTL